MHQLDFIALPANQRAAPDPRASPLPYALRHRLCVLRLRGRQLKLTRGGLHVGFARILCIAPLQQAVHGFADAGAGGINIVHAVVTRRRVVDVQRTRVQKRQLGQHKQRFSRVQFNRLQAAERHRHLVVGLVNAPKRTQTCPPALLVGFGRLNTGKRQPQTRARHRDIQRIDLLALALRDLNVQGLHGTRRWAGFAGKKDELDGLCAFTRPIDQHTHGVRVALFGVGVQQQHNISLQAFCAMDGQEPDSRFHQCRWGLHAACFERTHEAIGRDKPSAVQLQRHSEQGAQVRQYSTALHARCRLRKLRKHIAIVKNGLQRIMRWQLVHPGFPSQ